MATERIGYRRLYDAMGCSLNSRSELDLNCAIGEIEVKVYIGPKPKLGIVLSSGQGKYIVPGEISPVFKVEYKKDPKDSSYPRNFFTEILCLKRVEIDDDLSVKFHAKDTDAQNELLSLAQKNSGEFKDASDLIAGVLGLRFHPQFVLEKICENFFAVRAEDDLPFQIAGPWMQILESLSLNPLGEDMLTKHIGWLSQADPSAQEFGSSVLTWLLRAWTEREALVKFLAFFIPIEMILGGYKGSIESEMEKKENIKQIQNLILAHGGDNAKPLADFFQKITGNLRPSLLSRFEQMARDAKIDGWEADVIAFQRFNTVRNSLLHRGEDEIQLATTVNYQNIQDETRQLEDLTERYVSWALFRDTHVYQSQWRTERKRITPSG